MTAPLGLARGTGFLALALFASLHWMQLLQPTASQRAWYGVGAAALAMLVLLAAGRIRRALPRHALTATGAVGTIALTLPAGGIADEFLRPDRWGELASGFGRGLGSLPGARVPYRGLEEWTHLVIGTGGTLLLVLAALLAFWPRPRRTPGYPGAALVVLVLVYATPAISLDQEGQFLRGALLAILALAFLTLERLRATEVRAAAGLAAVAAVGALLAGPLLDADEPWFDYENWALSAASSRSTTFDWEHEYGPLDWPRDGREIIRVKARPGAYWKADALDAFDGQRWIRAPLANNEAATADIPDDRARQERWTQRIRVTVRNLRSRTYIAAGTPIDFVDPGRFAAPTGVQSVYAGARSLRRGDAYETIVYTPRPSASELRRAGTGYDSVLRRYLAFTAVVPAAAESGSVPAYEMQPAPFASGERHGVAFGIDASQPVSSRAENLVRRSTLARTWRLAQRMRAGAATPYDLVRRVRSYLAGDGFGYTERPPEAAQTLEGFLFDAQLGYCQQYSGAMALLLRMGGVPARVATGFSPGTFDDDTGEFVVRDFDAHSWVEAYFPGIGWVPFDPTPAASPARRQAAGEDSETAAVGDVDDLAPGDRAEPFGGADGAADAGPGIPWLEIAAGLGVALALSALVARRRRRVERTTLDDLERALRRARRPMRPATTLRALEASFGAPSAAEYVRALRDQRFAGGDGPSPRQRRALRSELASGGPAAKLRAWWALPPRLR